jgi:hypothetical protein
VPEPEEFDAPFGFPTMLRFWLVGLLAMALPNQGLIPEGFRLPLWFILVVGFIAVETYCRDRRIAKFHEAHDRFTEEELQSMLKGQD